MTRHAKYRLAQARSGLTLIELLIVAFILVMFVAVAAPLMRPATADRKVREASRQLNAYVAEAKAYASQRGRPVALVFDRAAAAGEAARNPNIVTRLNIAQSPPIYTGDALNDNVIAHSIPRDAPMGPQVTGMAAPPWYLPNSPTVPPGNMVAEINPPQINGEKARWYRLDFRLNDGTPNGAPNGSPMRNVIIATYMTGSPAFAPYRIRFGNKGPYFDGYVHFSGSAYDWIVWVPKGKELPAGRLVPFEIEFFPQITSNSPMELPTGTAVDLQYSGFGMQGNQFFIDPANGAAAAPLMLVFSPSGDVERVLVGGAFHFNLTRMHFLVGTTKRAIDATEAGTPLSQQYNVVSNLSDPACQWVSITARTGNVNTSDNLPTNDYSNLPVAIGEARAFATTLNTKGGE